MHRIDKLSQTGEKKRILCAEPLLGHFGEVDLTNMNWLVIGGESGPNCRPLEELWVVNLRNQCQKQNVLFTFKQWGSLKRKEKKRKENSSLLQGEYYHDLPQVMRD
jgi:protein gp37